MGPADVLTGHDLQLIAAIREAYPDATPFEIALAISWRPLEQLEELIRLYLAVGAQEALLPVRSMSAAEVDAIAPPDELAGDPLWDRYLDGDR